MDSRITCISLKVKWRPIPGAIRGSGLAVVVVLAGAPGKAHALVVPRAARAKKTAAATAPARKPSPAPAAAPAPARSPAAGAPDLSRAKEVPASLTSGVPAIPENLSPGA